jgi:large subunit ribosomal protein L22
MEARAEARYVRTSAQKARLVVDLIRGQKAGEAITILRTTNKRMAPVIEKVLRSAIANATQKDGFGGDVERLFVNACYANQGPSQKRIRPAPMGRAFRVVKRTAHLTVQVAEHPTVISTPSALPEAPGEGPKRPRGARPKAKPKTAAAGRKKKPAARKPAAAAKKKKAAGARKKKTSK